MDGSPLVALLELLHNVEKYEKELALSEVEPFERAIGWMHGRRLLCVGWQNERLVVGALCRGRSIERPYNALTVGRPYSIIPKSDLSTAAALATPMGASNLDAIIDEGTLTIG
jgi:hypothetical protein